jgi:peroxiredoxin
MTTASPLRFVLLGLVLLAGIALLPLVGRAEDKKDVGEWEGKPAPEISLNTLDDKAFKLSEQKGKVVVVDIWATWCPPCRKSLPHLNKMSEDKALTDRGLVVIASNSGEDADTIKKFVAENKYTFQILVDQQSSLSKTLGVRGIPTTLVVGRDGIVKNVFVGFGPGSEKTLDEAIEKALAAESPSKPS